VASLISTVGIKFDSGGAPQKLKVLQNGANKLEQAFNRLAGKTSKSSKGLGLFGKSAIGAGAGAKAGAVGVKAFGAAVKTAMLPILAFTTALTGVTAIFGTMKEMDFAAAKFETLGGDSDALIGKLKTLSIELNGAANTAELTGAAYDVASAGFTDAADAAMILKAASLGATGGFTDINTSGGAAVKVLNAYGLEAKDAAALMDKFAQTQADGIITIGQYSQNIGKVATTAAGLKVPLEEVNAVIAQSTAAGTNIETAFSGLNSALAKISSGQAGKKLGIDLNEATLRTEGLSGALAKLEGFSTGELQEAFGIEAFKGIQVAVEDTEKLNKLIANQVDSQGRAGEAAAIANDTIQGALERLGSSFKNIFADQAALGIIIKRTIQGASVLVDVIGMLGKAVNAVFSVFSGFGSEIAKAFGIGESSIVSLTDAWIQVQLEFDKGAKLATVIFTSVGKVIGALALAFQPLRETIPMVINEAKKLFMNFATGLTDIFKGLAEMIASIFRKIFKFIGDGINAVLERIPEPLKKFVLGTGEKIASVAGNVVGGLQEGFTGAMGTLKGFNEDEEGNKRIIDTTKFMEALEAASGDVNEAWAKYLTTTKEVNKELKKTKETTETDNIPAVNKLKEAFEGVKETIAGGLHGAVMGLIDGTKSLGESLAGIAKQIASLMLKKAIFGAFGLQAAEGAYVSNGIRPFAAGGMVTKPTMGLVGEAGEDEYIIPASKMAQSMQRYSSGARGESVIPGTGQSSAGGGANAQTTVNYSGPILNFNSEEFVPKSAIGEIINSAAARGAKAGEARTLSSLQNSRSRRQGIGL
jgi:TP901 family phage tail tape measure protein